MRSGMVELLDRWPSALRAQQTVIDRVVGIADDLVYNAILDGHDRAAAAVAHSADRLHGLDDLRARLPNALQFHADHPGFIEAARSELLHAACQSLAPEVMSSIGEMPPAGRPFGRKRAQSRTTALPKIYKYSAPATLPVNRSTICIFSLQTRNSDRDPLDRPYEANRSPYGPPGTTAAQNNGTLLATARSGAVEHAACSWEHQTWRVSSFAEKR